MNTNCSFLDSNVSFNMDNATMPTGPASLSSAEIQLFRAVKLLFYQVGIPVICLFGVVGNILNLLILTRKQLSCSMDRMEKSAHIGLVALAVSDMMFCVVLFPMPFLVVQNRMYFTSITLELVYRMYHEALLNTFLFTSTWLTVAMATARYFAVCHPIHARGFIDIRCTKVLIISIYVVSILFNLPFFWRWTLAEMPCHDGCVCQSMLVIGYIFRNTTVLYTYSTVWAVLGTFLPFVTLLYCNVCLIRALRRSLQMRRQHSTHRGDTSGHHLTPTLISIVILFMVLVCPSEFLRFAQSVILHRQRITQYALATYITNFLEAVNFAMNFLLYFLINSHFRKIVKRVLCCEKNGGHPKTNMTRVTFAHSSSDAETMV